MAARIDTISCMDSGLLLHVERSSVVWKGKDF